MLVKFKVGNFASFGKIQEFSMVAGSNGPESKRTFENIYPTILRSSFIYGQNSAGKSSFVRALIYSRGKIIGLDSKNPSISADFKYRMGGDYSHRNKDGFSEKEESYFEYYITTEWGLFSYGFEMVTKYGLIASEWLVHINETGSEEVIFERDHDSIRFSEDGASLEKIQMDDASELLLHAAYSKNVTGSIDEIINSIYLWFKDHLVIRTNDSVQTGLIVNDNVIKQVSNVISDYDTGVVKFKITPLSQRPTSEKRVKEDIDYKRFSICDMSSDESCLTVLDNRLISIKRVDGNLLLKEIMMDHISSEFTMMYRDESDGTKRLLLFLFLLSNGVRTNSNTSTIGDRTIVIDEIDRSMHTQMTNKIISDYIENSDMSSSQLIATTHECDALPKLRPDEIWFVDKTEDRESILYSMEEFILSSRDDLDELYLEGRFGAIPKVRPIDRSEF